ncbi:MAG: protein kinase [Acidobacteriota bacterium]
MMLSQGQRVAGRFTIKRFIAEGGMGEVYEAYDEVLGDAVALKFLVQRSADDEHLSRRFRREIQLARKVTHPNVCRLFDVYEHELSVGVAESIRVPFVTMELLGGPTLEERIDDAGPFSEREALPLVRQMCDGLEAAHAAGVVHRDFKSNNVLLVPRDEGTVRAVVTDFGLARSVQPSDATPLTADQLIVGTADYMAPEQIHGEPVSPASDIYALGVVLFEMMTGGKPYSAANPMQLLMLRIHKPPARPRSLRPDLSPTWEDVILSCLENHREDRPPSARAVAEALLEATPEDDEPTQTTVHALFGGLADGARDRPDPPGSGLSDAVSRLLGRSSAELRGMAPRIVHFVTTHPRTLGVAAFLTAVGLSGAVAAVLLMLLGADLGGLAEPPRPPGPGDSLSGFSPRRLTLASTLEIDPALSADGRLLAYSAEAEDGTFHIVVHDLQGESPDLRIDAGDGRAFQPSFDPDGSRLAFHAAGFGGIWLASLDGAPPQPLLERGSQPAFSPDGRRLVVQTDSAPLLSDTTAVAMPPTHLELYDFETGRRRALTRPGQPAGGHGAPSFSPDGRWVVFSSSFRAESEIWAVELATGRLQPLVRGDRGLGDGGGFDAVVTPDGRSVLFTSLSREAKTLWRFDIDPETFEVLSPRREIAGLGVSSIRQPTVSGDGTLIFSALITRSELFALPLEDGEPRPPARALTDDEARNNRPALSPDGRRVAFDHWRLGVRIRLVLLDLATGLRRHPTPGPSSQASWLPDGRIAYTRLYEDGVRELRAIDPASGTDTRLTGLDSDLDWSVVSPGGRYVAYHAQRDGQSFDIFVLDLATGEERRVTRHETAASFPCWAPDSRRLAYQVRRGSGTDLWITHIDGTTQRLTRDDGHSWPYSFSRDGRRIAFAAARGERWSLRWVDVETAEQGELVPPMNTRTGYLRYPTYAPDDDLLIYERSTSGSDLFVVDGYLPPAE